MKNETLYQILDTNRPLIQRIALGLTNDFQIARYLYHETAHLAMKNKAYLREETFKDWLTQTIKETYIRILLNDNKIKN